MTRLIARRSAVGRLPTILLTATLASMTLWAPATLLAPAARAAITAALYPTSSGGVSGVSWVNGDNAFAEDGQFASVTLSSLETSTEAWWGFDFSSIPADAEITGINVDAGIKWNGVVFAVEPHAGVDLFIGSTHLGGKALGSVAEDTLTAVTNGYVASPSLADLSGLSIHVATDMNLTSGVTSTLSVDYIRVAVLYNVPPVLTAIGDQSLATGQTLDVPISATDADGDPLTFGQTGLPSFGTFTDHGNGTATLHLAPGAGDTGDTPMTVTVSDGSLTDSEAFTIHVTANQPPVFSPILDEIVPEADVLNTSISATDPDGDPLTYGRVPGSPIFVAIDPAGAVHINPVCGDAIDSPYTVTATVDDGINPTVTKDFQVTVSVYSPIFDPFSDPTLRVATTASPTISVTSDGCHLPAITAAQGDLPAFASLTDNGDGTASLSLAPGFGDAGDYPATVHAEYPASTTTDLNFTIHVTANQPPVLNPIANKGVSEGNPLSFAASATDPDGDPLTYGKASGPAWMTVSTSGAITINAPLDSTTGSPYPASVMVSDGHGGTDTASFSITVAVFPPIFHVFSDPTLAEGDTASPAISVSSDGLHTASFFVQPGDLPAFATLTDNGDDTATLDLAPGFSDAGDYPAHVRAAYAGSITSTFDFTIHVTNTDRPPVLSPIPNRTVTEGGSIKVKINATDPDGDPITLSTGLLPPFASLTDHGDGTGTLTFAPGVGTAGGYPITVRADAGSLFDQVGLTLTVTLLDVTPPDVTVPADMAVEATSAAGAVVSFSASAVDDIDGSITPTCSPASGSTFPIGATLVTCTATDAHGNVARVSFSVTVLAAVSTPAVTLPPTDTLGSSSHRPETTGPGAWLALLTGLWILGLVVLRAAAGQRRGKGRAGR